MRWTASGRRRRPSPWAARPSPSRERKWNGAWADGRPSWTAPEDPDAISRSADFYARALLGRDTTGTLAPLMALRNEDGGFAWTEGMESSPVVTATLLERFAVLRDKGIAIPDMTKAVQYLDYSQFGNWFPFWCGGLSDDLLDRRIVTLTASDTVPFKDIQASGNEMRIERNFYLEGQDGKRTELQPGDTLVVGDKVIASYELWSKENRSFVRIDAFREACFVPADQLSGPVASSFPIRIDGVWSRMAQCYRDIRVDRTAWWLDVCPEETTHWEEAFFVTQAGTLTAE